GERPLHPLEPGASWNREPPGRFRVVELPRHRRARLEAEGARGDRIAPLLRTHPGGGRRAVQALHLGWARPRAPALGRPRRRAQVSVYSGPEPPSGGVRRPPFAVIAPH